MLLVAYPKSIASFNPVGQFPHCIPLPLHYANDRFRVGSWPVAHGGSPAEGHRKDLVERFAWKEHVSLVRCYGVWMWLLGHVRGTVISAGPLPFTFPHSWRSKWEWICLYGTAMTICLSFLHVEEGSSVNRQPYAASQKVLRSQDLILSLEKVRCPSLAWSPSHVIQTALNRTPLWVMGSLTK